MSRPPVDTPNSRRAAALQRLGAEPFDVVVVGGGITGAGVARDAALRGLKVALIEKLDFGAGTSSKSSKLIHGGLRYLEQAELGLVFESVNERRRLMKLARHLVRPLPFLVTNYKNDPRRLLTLAAGLWIYDALCFFGNYRNHTTYGRKKTLGLEPRLRAQGLKGSVLYYDCLTDDARLTLECALDAQALGAVVLNHARAATLLRHKDGGVCGVGVIDAESGKTLEVRSRVVVNATGPWSDEVRALAGEAPILRPTKGVHLVFDSARLPIAHALMLLSPRDRRAVFCIPWGLGRTIIGTTDTFFDGSPDSVQPTREDVDYLLETANSYFPSSNLKEADVLATWAGLRPLLKPADESAGASDVSREHMVRESPGFITIAGGKLTTFRLMAAEVVDIAIAQLGLSTKSTTAARPLPGSQGLEESDDALALLAKSLQWPGLPEGAPPYLAEEYGIRASQVLERAKSDPSAVQRLDPELPAIFAQVDEAVEVELARTLDDVLTRRVPLAMRARDQGLGVAQKVAARLAQKLEWSAERTAAELEQYRKVIASTRAFRS